MKRSTPRTITECSGSLFFFPFYTYFSNINFTTQDFKLFENVYNNKLHCKYVCTIWFYRTVSIHSNIKIVICLRHTTQFLLKNGMSNSNSKKKKQQQQHHQQQ